MEFLIVSGLSGGGKSRAADLLEAVSYTHLDVYKRQAKVDTDNFTHNDFLLY